MMLSSALVMCVEAEEIKLNYYASCSTGALVNEELHTKGHLAPVQYYGRVPDQPTDRGPCHERCNACRGCTSGPWPTDISGCPIRTSLGCASRYCAVYPRGIADAGENLPRTQHRPVFAGPYLARDVPRPGGGGTSSQSIFCVIRLASLGVEPTTFRSQVALSTSHV